MCYPRRTISLGFTDEKIQEGQHICYIFNDDTERLRVMSKYIESGLLADEKILYLVDRMTPKEMIDCLEELGVDVRSKLDRVAISEAAPVYCPSGVFQIQETLDLIRDFQQQALKDGYAGSRGTGEMTWCLTEGRVNEGDLMEYEARLNQLLPQYPYTTCCQYDARRFDGQTIMDVLSVHPLMIVRGQIVRNPYYIQPEVFLANYRERLQTGK